MPTTTTPATVKPVTFKGVLGVKPLLSYVDPHPGLHGSDRVSFSVPCDRCNATGVYRWWTHYGQAAGTCFKCFGTTKHVYDRAVVSIRKDAKVEAYARDYAADIAAHHAAQRAAAEAAEAAAAVERAAAEAEAAAAAAAAEEARIASLNNEPVGELGQRVRNIEATIEVSTGYERPSFRGYGTDFVKVVTAKLADGRVVLMKGQANALYGLDKGDQVRITGTVAGFPLYQGQLQTLLQRPAIEVVRED
jgi:hypothetical protein